MSHILVLQGPNLNLLGQRNPDVYGHQTLEDIHRQMESHARTLNLTLSFLQSNHEGQLIDAIQQAIATTQGLIINPAGLTHTSVSLRDALEVYPHPCIEVHLSNIYAREDFRKHSHISPVVSACVCGLGSRGYLVALESLADFIRSGRNGFPGRTSATPEAQEASVPD